MKKIDQIKARLAGRVVTMREMTDNNGQKFFRLSEPLLHSTSYGEMVLSPSIVVHDNYSFGDASSRFAQLMQIRLDAEIFALKYDCYVDDQTKD